MLGENGLRVDLLDVRSESIAYARARHERGEVNFYVGLLDQACPPSNDYDVVVCTEVIEHVPAPAEFLIRLKQKVKPGGALVLTTPNASYLFAYLPSYGAAKQSIVDTNAPNSMDGDAHTYLFTREDLATLIRGVGLRVEAHGFFLPVWLEGHLKTRVLHRWLYSLRNDILHSNGTLPAIFGRHLCASQYVVARAVSA
jgi:SAM-dependent methyltransferase